MPDASCLDSRRRCRSMPTARFLGARIFLSSRPLYARKMGGGHGPNKPTLKTGEVMIGAVSAWCREAAIGILGFGPRESEFGGASMPCSTGRGLRKLQPT